MTVSPGTIGIPQPLSFIEHIPATEKTRSTMRDAYNRTRGLYESVYGKPDERVWTDVVATCGDSYSGFIPLSDEVEDEYVDPFE